MGRIACAFVPRYELACRARQDPSLWERAAAVADLAERPARIRAATPVAEALGVLPGEVLARVRARVPQLEILSPDRRALEEAEAEVLGALATCSPLLDLDKRGAFFLGLAGLDKLIRGERAFAQKVQQTLSALSLTASVAVADSPFVAWAAAQRGPGLSVVPPTEGQKLLHTIALPALGLPERIQALLELLGITTAGAIADLPSGSLARRLGADGARVERLCRGEGLCAWPTSDKAPSAPEQAKLELDGPVEALEPLLFLFKSVVDRLMKALAQSRRALAELTVQVTLDDRSKVVQAFVLPRPSLDAPAVMALVRLWLERHPFPAPVTALELTASRAGTANARQLHLFSQRIEKEADALAQAAARLASTFGEKSVVRPTLFETFRPERRLTWEPFAPSRSSPNGSPDEVSPLVLRLSTPPERIGWSEGARRLTRAGQAPLPVVSQEGPRRLAGGLRDAPFDRSYYWLRLGNGERYWVFRDELDHQTYLHAVAD